MRKKWNMPLGTLILSSSFFMGGVLGFFLASLMTEDGQGTLADFFLSYFQAISEGSYETSLFTSLWSNLKVPLLIFLLGFSLIGTIGIPLLFAVEGFLFTFSISTLCRLLGVTGLIPAFFLFCMPAFLWIPVLFFMGLESFQSATLLWRRTRLEEIFTNGYFFRISLGVFGVLCSVALDYWVLPVILEALIPFLIIT